MKGNWRTVREAADELGVSPDTLTRRLRSGRSDARSGQNPDAALQVSEDTSLPPLPPMPVPRPQSHPAVVPAGEAGGPPPLPKPPLCTIPPAKPLPASEVLPPLSPRPREATADASTAAAAATARADYAPPRDRIDDAFLAAVEEELKEMRTSRSGAFVPAYLPAAPAVKPPEPTKPTAPVLDMAHPLHAQIQDARKQIRGMWVGVALLILAVLGGVIWTTVRMDRAERLIVTLIEQLDAERTLAATYKQEVGRLYQSLADSKAQQAKLVAQQQQKQDAAKRQNKRPDSRLTSGK